MRMRNIILTVLMMLMGYGAAAQEIVESIVAIVGDEVVYLSDVEGPVLQRKEERDPTPVDQLRCQVFEDILIQKLFLDQAKLDSIVVSPESVESDLNGRLAQSVMSAGSEEALEKYFKKSMAEIRQDLREALVDQSIVEQIQYSIAESVTVTPDEVKKYFNSISKDSLPLMPRRVELSIIQIEPPDMDKSKAEVRQKLLDLRSRIINGESFKTLAVLYSEDGSAPLGGELGFRTRGQLSKPYADAAWVLKKDVVSKIVESEFGFHIIQLIDRKGDMVNTRHIIMRPKLSTEQSGWSINRLDSIADLIRKDSLSFEKAARLYSSDKATRANGGKMVLADPSERVTWFTLDQLSKEINMTVRDMKLGEVSEPFRTTDERGSNVYCIIRLDNEIAPHRANLQDDYNFVADAAMREKENKVNQNWIREKIKNTYIKISEEFRGCSFYNDGWLQ